MGGGYLNKCYPNDSCAREFWRLIMMQQEVAKQGATAIDYPPMQLPAPFNLEAVTAKVDKAIRNHEGQ